jgi:hypothetical protein
MDKITMKLKSDIDHVIKLNCSNIVSQFNKLDSENEKNINHILEMASQIEDMEKELEKTAIYKKEISELKDKCEQLEFEIENYNKVSIVQNLTKQLTEKDREIYFLKKKVNRNLEMSIESNNTSKDVIKLEVETPEESNNEAKVEESNNEAKVEESNNEAEAEESNNEAEASNNEAEASNNEAEAEESNNDDEEEEVNVVEKKLRNKIYYITDDTEKYIYEKLETGDIGECVGKYNSKNRPKFFKTM